MEVDFLTQNYLSCLNWIEKLSVLFPEDNLTGRALLRMGQIYEIEDHAPEALDIYHFVLSKYENPSLKRMSQDQIRALGL